MRAAIRDGGHLHRLGGIGARADRGRARLREGTRGEEASGEEASGEDAQGPGGEEVKQRVGNFDLDLLTQDELHAELQKVADRLDGGGPRRVRGAATGKTDASGNADIDVYDVNVGGEFALSRLVVKADNATPGVPVIAATGFLNLLRSGILVDFYGVAKTAGGLSLPLRDTWGNHDAPFFRNGELVQVQIRGYTASMGVTIEIMGWEDRTDI